MAFVTLFLSISIAWTAAQSVGPFILSAPLDTSGPVFGQDGNGLTLEIVLSFTDNVPSHSFAAGQRLDTVCPSPTNPVDSTAAHDIFAWDASKIVIESITWNGSPLTVFTTSSLSDTTLAGSCPPYPVYTNGLPATSLTEIFFALFNAENLANFGEIIQGGSSVQIRQNTVEMLDDSTGEVAELNGAVSISRPGVFPTE